MRRPVRDPPVGRGGIDELWVPHEDRRGERSPPSRPSSPTSFVRAIGVPVVDIPDGFEEIAPRPVVRSTLDGVIAAGLGFAAVARLAGAPTR